MDRYDLIWGIINSDNELMRARIAREEKELTRSMRVALMEDESSLVRLTFVNRDDVRSKLRQIKHTQSDKTAFLISFIV